jgi:predicted AAA+ superfamily ATPase
VKTPKLYFYDTGLACALMGIESSAQIATHPMRGHLFENMMVTEFVKYRYHRGLQPNCYFWRDKVGNEVDCIIDHTGTLTPVEIKAGETVNADYFKGLRVFNAQRNHSAGYLVYGGSQTQDRTEAHVLGWRDCTRAMPRDDADRAE